MSRNKKNNIFANKRSDNYKRYKSQQTPLHAIILRILFLMLFPLSFLLVGIAQSHPQFIEKYLSRGLNRTITSIISKYFNLFGFSVTEIIIYCLIIFGIFTIFLLIKRLIQRNIRGFLSILLCGAMIFSTGYFSITVSFSLNYYRVPLVESLNYKTGNPTAEELADVTSSEISQINELSKQINYDKNGISYYDGTFDNLSSQVFNGYYNLSNKNSTYQDIFGYSKPRPKPVMISPLWSYSGIAGMYVPITREANVNTDIPQFMLPFNASHESAHFRGFAREQEANFIAYLSCINNDDVYFQYSAHMSAYLYLANALYQTDQSLWKETVSKLDKSCVGDFVYYNQYLDDHSGKVQEVSNNINDSFLKSQGQAGVITYNMFVQLLCDKYRTEAE